MQRIERTFDGGLLVKETILDEDPAPGTPADPIVKALATTPDADAAYRLIKAEAPNRFTLGVAYAANKVDVAKARDGHRDFADPAALEQCAWDYLRKGAQIGLFHEQGTYGHADVVESYIYRGPDWEVTGVRGDTYLIKAGDWMLGAIWDELGFEAVQKQLVNGWSPQGRAKRLQPTPYDLAQLRS